MSSEDKSVPGPDEPESQTLDGNARAWLVVLGAWCMSFASFGIINSFGIYETHYLQSYLHDEPTSAVAWIGSIQVFAQFSTTPFAGPMTDRCGPMVIILPCSLLLVVAMMLTSVCRELYQFILCQGILLGATAGLVFFPAIAVVGQYFVKDRPLAMAVASTGSPVGGIIYPVVLNRLIPHIGFPWAQRVCGFISLFLVSVALVTIRPSGAKRSGKLFLLEAFAKPAYSLQVGGLFLVMLGIYTPYFYLATYGTEHGMGSTLAGYLFALLNAGSLVGRLIAGFGARHVGMYNVMAFACLGSGLLVFCWLSITSTGGLIALAILYGATSGIVIALMMATLAHTAGHPSQIGTYLGQATFIVGFAGLAGPPASGALIKGGYSSAIIFSGSVIMARAALMMAARYAFARDRWMA